MLTRPGRLRALSGYIGPTVLPRLARRRLRGPGFQFPRSRFPVFFNFPDLLVDFLPLPRRPKKDLFPKTSQIIKSPALGRPRLRFQMILDDLWAPLFEEFQQNLSNCSMYNPKCLFLLFNVSHFGIENHAKMMSFEDTFLDTLFCDFISRLKKTQYEYQY